MTRLVSLALVAGLALSPLAALAVPPPPPPPPPQGKVEAASAVVSDGGEAKRLIDAEAECKAACSLVQTSRLRLADAEATEARAKTLRSGLVAAVASRAGLVAEGRTYAVKVSTETVDGVESRVVRVVAYEPAK